MASLFGKGEFWYGGTASVFLLLWIICAMANQEIIITYRWYCVNLLRNVCKLKFCNLCSHIKTFLLKTTVLAHTIAKHWLSHSLISQVLSERWCPQLEKWGHNNGVLPGWGSRTPQEAVIVECGAVEHWCTPSFKKSFSDIQNRSWGLLIFQKHEVGDP
jgi:hypothetical protein